YRMFGAGHELLYVGKARSLKDRVGTYFAAGNVNPKVQALTAQISAIEVTVTNSETEALLLEYNLIKAHKPRFNVVLRDDKSFPYIQLCVEHEFPRLMFYRGARSGAGRYFGPFPNAGAVRDTLNQLQKLFRIRNCRDSFFANRSRPCLQHQIGRCSAPCVGLITREGYAQDMAAAVKVLEGRSDEVNAELQGRMEEAGERLQLELAARIRDQLAALKRIQAQQVVTAEGHRDVDVFAIVGEAGEYAVSVMLVRGGRNLGTTSYFPRAALAEAGEALASFVMQYYASAEAPAQVLLGTPLEEAASLAELLSSRSGRAVEVRHPLRGLAVRWVELTQENAVQALRMRFAQRQARAPGGSAGAGPAADRRRRGTDQPGARGARGAGLWRPDTRRGGQGSGPQARAGAAVRVRRGSAGDARGPFSGRPPHSENPRRSASVRDQRSSPQARAP